VELDKAIFMFISDFGLEGRTVDMTLEQLQELVNTDAKEIWKDFKQIQLVLSSFSLSSTSLLSL